MQTVEVKGPAFELKARPVAVLFDLLMAVMNSLEVWVAAAEDRQCGLAWRDEVTRRMAAAVTYVPYEELVVEVAGDIGLAPRAPAALWDRWSGMEPWPDASTVHGLALPHAFVTNCSMSLATVAAQQSGLLPRFTLSAQEAGWYKPDVRVYREACRRVDRPTDRVLFVAGSPYDAEGAQAAGLPVVRVARRPDHVGGQSSTPVVESIGEIVAAIERRSPEQSCDE